MRDAEDREAQGVEGVGNGEGESHSPADWGLGERRKLPQRGWGKSPGENDFTAFQACQNASRCNVC